MSSINAITHTYIYYHYCKSDLISKVTILKGLISLHIYYSIGNTFLGHPKVIFINKMEYRSWSFRINDIL